MYAICIPFMVSSSLITFVYWVALGNSFIPNENLRSSMSAHSAQAWDLTIQTHQLHYCYFLPSLPSSPSMGSKDSSPERPGTVVHNKHRKTRPPQHLPFTQHSLEWTHHLPTPFPSRHHRTQLRKLYQTPTHAHKHRLLYNISHAPHISVRKLYTQPERERERENTPPPRVTQHK